MHDVCRDELGVPMRWVSQEEARRLEPGVRAETGALESPTTGILDSHAFMLALTGMFEDAGGILALSSAVTAIKPVGSTGGSGRPEGSGGWEIQVRDDSNGEESTITTEVLVNSAGLGAVAIHNMIVPSSKQLEMFYAKGNYFSYNASSPKVGRLIYPAPEPGLAGLGTHLTLDMAGRIRFGPDVEWVDSPDDLSVNPARLPEAITAIRQYLPDVEVDSLVPDYSGIRPKLGKVGRATPGKGFQDFIVRKEEGYEGWVNLLGIESPGLTSSLAIAERVEKLLYE
jgi:2-hydroxyglutarate dehydrogenase